MTTGLYAALDHDSDRHLVLGLIADAHTDAGEYDEAKAVRLIRRWKRWPAVAVDDRDAVDWWTLRLSLPQSRIGHRLAEIMIHGPNPAETGRYVGPTRYSDAIRDLVRVWVQVVREKRERIARTRTKGGDQ